MSLHGKNFIGSSLSAQGQKIFSSLNPRTGLKLDTPFHEATEQEINRAMELAAETFPILRASTSAQITAFLESIAAGIDLLGDQLIDQAIAETGLGRDRLIGERARTTNQLRIFAALVKEGSFVDARIDPPLPDRKPLPRPDLRRLRHAGGLS